MRPIKGVVSNRSIRALLIWLHAGNDYITELIPQRQITEVIELARLCDMCLINGADVNMALIISRIIFMHPLLQHEATLITNEHLYLASRLPRRNAFRALIVRAWVGPFLWGKR
ncbi:hypothetical protein N7454_000704 [Penicillium verhagenii]|nr:hypothetical protein N7454_000704 [Penicillium verhagenii]